MLALLGYLMIILFMVLLLTKKISPFVGLILVPTIFGIVAALFKGAPVRVDL